MGLRYIQGDTLQIHHTPVGAVSAGDVVLVDNVPCIAHNDIAAGVEGTVAYPSGKAIYEFDGAGTFTSSEDTLAAGDALYVETGGNFSDVSTSNFKVGDTLAAIANAAGSDGVRVVHRNF